MKNWIKIVLGIFGTVLLGAIGSGLWERFLSKIIDLLVSFSVEFVNAIFKSYKDGIYETASLGFHEGYSFQLFLLCVMLLPVAYLRLIKKHPEYKNTKSEFDQKSGTFIRSKNGYIFLKILTVSVTISCLFIVSKISYTNRVITYSMRSLDIVRPHVTPLQYYKLVSQFYQVRNTDDYDKFNNDVQIIAEKNLLILPKNAPLQ